MLKLKVISGILIGTLAINSIALIPFSPQDFSNIQNYITKSEHEMQLANDVILQLEKNLNINNSKIKNLEIENKNLNTKINTQNETINNQADKIKSLEKELNKQPSQPKNPFIIPKGFTDESQLLIPHIQKAFDQARFNTRIYSINSLYNMILQYFYMQNDEYWANYFINLLNQNNTNQNNTNQLLRIVNHLNMEAPIHLSILENYANNINNQNIIIQLPSNIKASLNKVHISENIEQQYQQLINNYIDDCSNLNQGYEIGKYRAQALASLYVVEYLQYLVNNPPNCWSGSYSNELSQKIQLAKNYINNFKKTYNTAINKMKTTI